MLRTWLAVGRHSRMLSMSLALPSGSLGKRTLSASRSIWYRALVNSGSGNSRRQSFSTPVNQRCFVISVDISHRLRAAIEHFVKDSPRNDHSNWTNRRRKYISTRRGEYINESMIIIIKYTTEPMFNNDRMQLFYHEADSTGRRLYYYRRVRSTCCPFLEVLLS